MTKKGQKAKRPKDKTDKPLKINKETVTDLEPKDGRDVKGGDSGWNCNQSFVREPGCSC